MLNEFVEKILSMNVTARAAKTPRRKLKFTSTSWAVIFCLASERPALPLRNRRLCARKRNARIGSTKTIYGKRPAEHRSNTKIKSRRRKRPRQTQENLSCAPRIWQRACLFRSTVYRKRSRRMASSLPAPSFENEFSLELTERSCML